MQGMLAKVDTLRSEVKRRKEEIYAQRSCDADAPDVSVLHDGAGALRNLQSQLDDLWNGIYTRALDARAASLQFEFIEQACAQVLGTGVQEGQD